MPSKSEPRAAREKLGPVPGLYKRIYLASVLNRGGLRLFLEDQAFLSTVKWREVKAWHSSRFYIVAPFDVHAVIGKSVVKESDLKPTDCDVCSDMPTSWADEFQKAFS